MNDIAFWSVLPSLSQKEKVRANLTTLLSIFVSIGTFAVGGIVPMLASGQQETTFQITAIVTSVLFFLSQLILVIFMKEKKIDEEEAKNNENIKLREIFSVLFKNDQLRAAIIGILLFYTGSGILVAAGLNFFYFSFGYKDGGFYQLIFTVVFALATFAGQGMYQVFVNKWKFTKKKLFGMCAAITISAYILLFLFILLPDYKMFFPLLCVAAFIAFFGQTIMSLILYIMIQDTIDYNMYKYNERRESAIFSLRAFVAKLSGSIQQGILYIFLSVSSLFVVSNTIANLEREYVGNSDYIIQEASKITGAENIELWQRIVFHIGFTIIPLLLFLATYLVIKFKYKITEEAHEDMLKAIEERKANHEG
jgi:melibiose permease/lactose/raffinose/galactose permease